MAGISPKITSSGVIVAPFARRLLQELEMRFAFAAAFSLSIVLLAGCGRNSANSKGPDTVPIRGKVVFTRGGTAKALFDRQARIELESVDRPGVRAVGAIEEDGSFTVATITSEGGSPGAVAGTHRVRLDLEDNAQKLVAPQF